MILHENLDMINYLDFQNQYIDNFINNSLLFLKKHKRIRITTSSLIILRTAQKTNAMTKKSITIRDIENPPKTEVITKKTLLIYKAK